MCVPPADWLCCREGSSDRAPLRPGKVSPKLEVPAHIKRPPYADSGMMPDWDPNPQIHDAAGIEKMRAAGRLAAQVRCCCGCALPHHCRQPCCPITNCVPDALPADPAVWAGS